MTSTPHDARTTTIFIILGTLLVYLACFSQQQSFDGPLQDIAVVTRGDTAFVPPSRHPLYTWLGRPYFQIWRSLGYAGDARIPLLVVNAVCGALTIGGVFASLRLITRRTALAMLLALAYAFSYGYWFFVEDAFYNVSTFVPVAWALYILLRTLPQADPRRRMADVVRLAILVSAALAATMQHLVFVPVVAAALLLGSAHVPPRARLASASAFTLAVALLAGGIFLGLSIVAAHCQSPACARAWLSPYGDDIPPMYRSLGWNRIPALGHSFISAIVPVWRGLRVRDLMQGVITPDRLIGQTALALTVLTFMAAGWVGWRSRTVLWQRHRDAIVLAVVWLAVYLPVIAWFDPFGPELWILPLLAVIMILAVIVDGVWDTWPDRLRRRSALVGGLTVATIAAANFQLAIWPDHSLPNPDIAKARAAVGQMGPQDLIVSPFWDWTYYVDAAGGERLNLLDLSLQVAGREPDPPAVLERLDTLIRQVQADGGRVWMVDISAKGPGAWAWMATNTGLTPDHFARYDLRRGITVDRETLSEIHIRN